MHQYDLLNKRKGKSEHAFSTKTTTWLGLLVGGRVERKAGHAGWRTWDVDAELHARFEE